MKGYMITDSHHEDNVLISVSSYGETVYVGPAKPIELPTEEEIRALLDKWDVRPPETQIAVIAPDSFTELQKSPHVFRAYLTEAITNLLKGER